MRRSPMSQSPSHLSDDTSDRLYTPEELARYAAAEAGPVPHRPDPLSDPLPQDGETTVIRPRAVPAGPPPSGPPTGPPPPPPVRPAGGPPTGPPPPPPVLRPAPPATASAT